MGKRMDTVIYIDKQGKPVDIKRACFKIVNHQVHQYTYIFNKFRSMDLPDVLDCFINGMSYRQAARYLDVAVSTVFRRRLKIQMLYNAL